MASPGSAAIGISRGLGVHRRRAAAAVRAAIPSSRWSSPPATPRPAPRWPTCTRAWRPRYPDLVFEPYDPDAARRRSTSCSSALPHGASPGARARAARAGSARRRPGRRLPAAGRRRCTRSGTARSTPRPSCSTSSPTACPSCSATTSPAAAAVAAPGATRRPPPWPSRRWSRAGLDRADRHRSSTPPAACRARAGRRSRTRTFCTVDEDFTAYGLLDHRHTPEIEQAHSAARRCCSRRTWRR